jgi:hypothetical protein
MICGKLMDEELCILLGHTSTVIHSASSMTADPPFFINVFTLFEELTTAQ